MKRLGEGECRPLDIHWTNREAAGSVSSSGSGHRPRSFLKFILGMGDSLSSAVRGRLPQNEYISHVMHVAFLSVPNGNRADKALDPSNEHLEYSLTLS